MKTNWLTVLEADWSDSGTDRTLRRREDLVGPRYTYRELLKPLCGLFDVDIDHGFFAGPKGLEALLSRFSSHKQRKVLCLTSHGSPTKLYTSGGDIPIWDILRCVKEKKEGVLLAACKVGAWEKRATGLLENGNFGWVAAYREESAFLSALQAESTFWKCYFDDWNYYKLESGSKGRCVSLKVKGHAIQSALVTYLLQPASIGQRFDVRSLDDSGDTISSLEIFASLASELDISTGLNKVRTRKPSLAAASGYRPLFERIWDNQWEWWPAD